MARRTVTAALVAAIGVLAVGLAAATLTSTVVPESGVGGGGTGGDGGGSGFGAPPPEERPIESIEIPFLGELVLLLLVLSVLVALGYVIAYRREVIPVLVAATAVAGAIWLLFYLVSDVFGAGSLPMWGPANRSGFGGGLGGGTAGSGGTVRAPLVTFMLFGVVVLGALLVVARSSALRSRLDDRLDDTDGDTDPETEAIGRAAGRAADRIEDGEDFDNDIYRAWQEMTSLLDVSRPDATTPREFSAAAVDAGMASDDVRELTRLFEDVRYGDDSPTPSRERRAVRVFRRLETEYAGDDT